MKTVSASVAMLAGLVACAATAQVPEWRPAEAAAKALPARWAALPAGSVTPMVRSGSKAGGPWVLHLPDGSRYTIEGISEQRHPNGDRSHAGTVAGAGALYPVLLTVGREATFGSFRTPGGRWQLVASGDQGWLLDLAHRELQLEPADAGVAPAPTLPSPRRPGLAQEKAAAQVVIDVLFLYDQAFAERYPGGAAQTRINHYVAVANQAFADSDVSLALRLVGAEATTWTDPRADNGIALEQLARTLAGEVDAFPGLAARRAALGADLVTLVRPHDIELRGSCGIAYFPDDDPALGVNVLSDSFDGWSLCSDDVYAHEVGHNLGAQHQDGANAPDAGFATPWILPGRLHTVMGSFGTGHPDRYLGLSRFSNPALRCGGGPCGQAGVHDNARKLRETMAAVSAYQPARSTAAVEAPPPLDPDVDGDGIPESEDAFPHDPRFHADADNDGVANEVDAFPSNPAEWQDTDGDGIGNVADTDDDGDGVADGQDAFPLDATASSDVDGDGVADGSDAFPQDRRQWADSDGDGIGDLAETDADGDGVAAFGDGGMAGSDLLVISAGTDRILRFDADSGLWAGVEVAEAGTPVALGSQSAMAWNPYRKELLALAGQALRRYPRTAAGGEVVLRPPAAAGDGPTLGSSFPAGLAVAADGTLFVADDGARMLTRHDAVDGSPLPGGMFWQEGVFPGPVRDLVLAGGSLWVLERGGRISRFDPSTGALLQASTGGAIEAPGFSALALSPAGDELFIADLAHDRVLRAPLASPGFTRTAVAPGSGGLEQPAGLAFGPDGLLYVSSLGTDQVLRFDPGDGRFVDVFTRAPPGVLSQPRDLLFVPRVRDRFPTDPGRRFLPVPGGWSNPARSGHGLDLQRVGDVLAVIWYTFEQDGTPTWYLGSGPLSGARWEATLHRFHWDAASLSASSEPVGSASLEFSDERHAVFGWELAGSSGSEPMRPLQVGTSSETQFPTAAWYSPAESGWGLSVTRQGEIAYAIAFVYDAAGEPTWLTAAGASSDAMQLPALRYFAPTRCPGCPGSAGPEASPAGELGFTALDGNSARITAGFDTGGGSWERSELEFTRLTESPTRPGADPLH